MKLCWTLLERVAAVIALATVLVLLAVDVAERSGLTANAAQRALNLYLPDGEWTVGACRVDLAGPSIEIEDLAWSREGRGVARADLVRATFSALGWGGGAIERVTVRGAEVTAGKDLVQALTGGESADEGGGARPEQFADRAQLSIEDLIVRTDEAAELARASITVDLVDGSELLVLVEASDAHGNDGRVAGRGRLDADGRATIDLSARALPLAPLSTLLDALLPEGTRTDGELSNPFDVTGSLSFDARARGRTDLLEEVEWSLELDDVSVRAPSAELCADDAGARGRGRWRHDGTAFGEWTGDLRGQVRWSDAPVAFGWRGDTGADHGPRAIRAPFGELFVHTPGRAPDANVEAVIGRIVGSQAEQVTRTFEALSPSGQLDAWLGVRVREADPAPRGKTGITADLAIYGELGGTLGARVDGWKNDRGERSGFPLDVTELDGRAVYGHEGDAAMRDRLAVMGVMGRTPSTGRLVTDGWLASPLPPGSRMQGPVGRRARLDFRVRGDDVRIDEHLTRAVLGTGAGLDLDALLEPSAGSIDADVVIAQQPQLGGTVVAVDARVTGAAGRYVDRDVAFADAAGEVVLRMGARTGEAGDRSGRDRRAFGYALDLDGRAAEREQVGLSVAGALRTADPTDPAATVGATLSQWRIGASGLDLDDPLLVPYLEGEVADALASAAVRARLSLTFTRAQSRYGGEALESLDVRASGVEAQWEGLAIGADRAVDPSAVRLVGERRVLSGAQESERSEPWSVRATAVAVDGNGARYAIDAQSDGGDGALRLVAATAGLEPAHASYRSFLEGPLDGSDGSPGFEGVLDGRAELSVDANGALDLEEAELDLRENALVLEGLTLRDLVGRLVVVAGRVESQRVVGRLANSPFELRDLRLFLEGGPSVASPVFELPAGPDGRPIDVLMTARAFAQNLVIDPRELVPDDPDVARWAIDHRWRGLVDVEGVELAVGLDAGGAPVTRARGRLVPHDLYVNYALPVRLRSAQLDVIDLVADSAGVRCTARIVDAYGDVAEQTLARTSARLDLSSTRLVIDELNGVLGGGTVTGSRLLQDTNTAVVLDFGDEPRFDVALSFARVDVGETIGRLFGSQVQNRGRLSGDLRLSRSGSDRLTDLEGAARLRIDDARLWSIPVVRDVFAALGLDATATFDWLRADVRLRDGRLELTDAEAHSPLVRLVGGGYLDMDGSLEQRYDLQYSVVDQLPLLSQLFYWVQSRLVRISIGGTVDRPSIDLVSILLPLGGSGGDGELLLPLPPTTPLPDRF